jgi:hypothetical protein
MRTALVIVGVFVCSASSNPGRTNQDAQEWKRSVGTNLVRERVVGLLNLPELVGDGCGRAQPASVNLYDSPSAAAVPIGSIRFQVTDPQADRSACEKADLVVRGTGARVDEEIPTDESDYEVQAAVVYERAGSWFRIALQRGSGWIARQTESDFQPYPEALEQKLTYIREGWDGRLWRAPASGTSARVPSTWTPYLGDDVSAQILEVRRVRDETWIRVRLDAERCGETLKGVVATTGWLPAYQQSGRTSLWFYARGC